MKITITVDCTPEEARTFLGVPDFSAVQQQMMQAFQDNINQQMAQDPDAAKAWFGPGLQNLSDMQKNYWQQFFRPGPPKEE